MFQLSDGRRRNLSKSFQNYQRELILKFSLQSFNKQTSGARSAKWFDFHLIMYEFEIVALVKLLLLMTRGLPYEYF